MSNRVFICHSSKDRAIAERVRLRLEAFDLPCWIAPRDIRPGLEFADGIMEGIESTTVFVIVLTDAANQSNDVLREVNIAARSKKVIMTLWVGDVEPTKALDYYLSVVQWLDARSSRFEQALSDLKSAVQAEFARHETTSEEKIDPPEIVPTASHKGKSLQPRLKLANPKMAAIGTLGLFFGVTGLSIWTGVRNHQTRQPTLPIGVSRSLEPIGRVRPEKNVQPPEGDNLPPVALTKIPGWQTLQETGFLVSIPMSWKKIKPREPDKGLFEYSNLAGASLLIASGEKWPADPMETPRSEAARFRRSPTIYQLAHSTVQLTTLAGANAAEWDFELKKRKRSSLPWGEWEHRRIYYIQNSNILYVMLESRKDVWNFVADKLTRAANSIKWVGFASAANATSPTQTG